MEQLRRHSLRARAVREGLEVFLFALAAWETVLSDEAPWGHGPCAVHDGAQIEDVRLQAGWQARRVGHVAVWPSSACGGRLPALRPVSVSVC